MSVLCGETRKLIANAELKVKLCDLKELYGRVPEEGTTEVEMQARYDVLNESMEKIIDEYVRTTGERPDTMKATHAVAYNDDFPQKKYNDIEVYANIDDNVLRKAPITTQEGIGNLLLGNAEYLIRMHQKAEIERRTAAEWRLLEREHITSSKFTLMDLYSDFKDIIELGVANYLALLSVFGFRALPHFNSLLNWEDYRQERKKWKSCKHRFCLNMFPIDKDNFKFPGKKKKSDAKYCCGACNENEKYARRCYEKTSKFLDNATYLPDYFYEEITEDWKSKRTRQSEITLDMVDIEKQINKNVPIRNYVPKKEKPVVYGCVTRKLSDLTPEELESEKWSNSKNIRRIAR